MQKTIEAQQVWRHKDTDEDVTILTLAQSATTKAHVVVYTSLGTGEVFCRDRDNFLVRYRKTRDATPA